MTTGTQEPIATGSESVAVTTDALTDMFQTGAFDPANETPTPEAEEPAVEAVEPAVEETVEEDGNPLDTIVADLSDDQQRELASMLGGRLGADLGKLRAENRELRAAMETETAKKDPFKRPLPADENPYANHTDLGKLEEIYDSALDVIKNGEAAIEKNPHADADDEIYEVGERNLTLAEVRDMVQTARKAYEDHIPARVAALNKTEELDAQRREGFKVIQEIHPWLAEEGNDLRKGFEAARDSMIGKVRDHMPDLLPLFDIVLADHFAAAKARVEQKSAPKEAPQQGKPNKPRSRPPGVPGGGAAASGRPVSASKQREKLLEGYSKASKGMTEGDLIQFLATS